MAEPGVINRAVPKSKREAIISGLAHDQIKTRVKSSLEQYLRSFLDTTGTNRSILSTISPQSLTWITNQSSDANPNDRVLFVGDAEVARVVALNPDQILPAPVAERLAQMGAGQTRKLKGRKRTYQGMLGALWKRIDEDRARDFYVRSKARFKALKAAGRLEHWRRLRDYREERAPSDAAAEHTRRVYYPHASRRRLMNRLFSRNCDA